MTTFKCSIINTNALGQRCGYGEGKTWEIAQANALTIALRDDCNAKIDGNTISISTGYAL